MENYINFFLSVIYPNILSGEYSRIFFTFLTTEVFMLINNNILLLLVTAKIFKVVSGWTSNTIDDKIASKYMSFLDRFRPNPIKEVKEEKDETVIVKEL